MIFEYVQISVRISPCPVRDWSKSKGGGGGVGRRKIGGGSTSFEPCKGVGHPIFQLVVVGWVVIVSDKV